MKKETADIIPQSALVPPPTTELPEAVAAPARPTLRHRPVPAVRKRPTPRLQWVVGAAVALAIGVGLTRLWMPTPVAVDLAIADTGPLAVSVNEDGRTRVKDRYVIAAPLAGTVLRLELRPGDSVRRGDVIAQVVPLVAPLLDPRSRAEAEARLGAARAALRQAETAVERARAAAGLAQREVERQHALLRAGATAQQTVEQADLAARMRAGELASAEFGLRVAASEVRLARAALLRLDQLGGAHSDHFEVRAPVAGQVLRVTQESEGVIQPGATLLEIGDPQALEVVVDVLSSDAAEIRPGAPVLIERWGGDSALRGHVHRIEPSAFTRISSLGVEEQRVNVIVDLEGLPERRGTLGDGYQVEARIMTWQAPDVLQVPAGAVFRHDDSWAVYVVDDGTARLRSITVGRRNGDRAQVLRGLRPGERVVVYPGDNVMDGVKVKGRT